MKSTEIIQPSALVAPLAYDGIKSEIPVNATGTNAASVAEGFPEITSLPKVDGGVPPVRADFNGMFYLSTDQRTYLQNGGLITFSQDVSDTIGGYPKGAVLDYISLDGTYQKVRSLVDDNTYDFNSDSSYIDDKKWENLSPLQITNMITNCILSSPNGVFTNEGSIIKVKAGVKYLSSAGRNQDGSLKNKEITIPSDVSVTFTGTYNDYAVVYYRYNNGASFTSWCSVKQVYYTNNSTDSINANSSETQIWFNKFLNEVYVSDINTTTWVKADDLVLCGYIYTNGSAIASIRENKPVGLLKCTDKSEISCWGMPSDKYVDLALGISNSTYVAPANGYFCLTKIAGGIGQGIGIYHQSYISGIGSNCYGYYDENGLKVMVPVKKDDVVSVWYNATGLTQLFRFYYAEGAK